MRAAFRLPATWAITLSLWRPHGALSLRLAASIAHLVVRCGGGLWWPRSTAAAATARGPSNQAAMQIKTSKACLGRASIKLGTSVALGGGAIVAYPFATASVYHEFAGDVKASVSALGARMTQALMPNVERHRHDNGQPHRHIRPVRPRQFLPARRIPAGSALPARTTAQATISKAFRSPLDCATSSIPMRAVRKKAPAARRMRPRSITPGPVPIWVCPPAATRGNDGLGLTRTLVSVNPDFGRYLAGGQAGYNYQMGRLVWAPKADFTACPTRGAAGAIPTVRPSAPSAAATTM